MKLDATQTQQVKTAFLAYSQAQPKVSLAMIDQFICGAIPGLSYEQLTDLKKAHKGSDEGYDVGQFFALVNSNEAFQHFCIANYPPAPKEEKAPEVDALALKAEKGF
jgi:hypothetical protein